MRRFFAIVFLFLMLPLADAQAEDCTLHQFASIPFVENSENAPIVDVQIAGHGYHLLVDTGGVYSMLNADAADSLKLSQHEIANGVEVYDVAGRRIRNYVEAPGFKLGPIALDKFAMMVQRQPMIGTGLDGTLGVDFLSHFDVELDFAGHKLNLFSPDHCPDKVVYWAGAYAEVAFTIKEAHIVVPVTLDGHDLKAILDTGTGHSTISEAIARRVFSLADSSAGMERNPDAKAGDLVQYRFHFKSLSFNGVAVSNPLIYILPDKFAAGYVKEHDDKLALDPVYGVDLTEPNLTVGIDVLSKLHLFISYKEKTVYLTSADAH